MATKINKNKVIAAAQKFVEKGQFDKAIKEYAKIVEEDPRDVRIWLKIGDLHAKRESTKEAVDTYAKVAEFYSEQGFYLKAVAVYKQILKLDGNLVEINLRLAELYKQLGLLSDAMQQYEQVSNFYHQAGRTKEALAALRQIVDLDPQNVASRIKLAELYSKEQMREEAVEEFSKAADFLRAENRIDDFVKVAERLVFHQPDNLTVTKELAGIYLRKRDPRRALQKLQLAFKADPRDEETLEMLAQAFEDLGQVPKTVSVLKELAHIQAENGHDDKRRETYQRILTLAPNDEEARQALSEAPAAPGPSFGDEEEAAPLDEEAAAPADRFYGDERRTGFDEPRAGGYDEPHAGGYEEPPPSHDRRYPRDYEAPYEAPEHLEEEVSASDFDDYGIQEEAAADEVIEEELAPPPLVVPKARTSLQPALQPEPLRPGRSGVLRPSGTGEFADEVAKILTEADVYIKYGLHEKAVDHLRQIFTRAPENLEAHLKLKDLYLQLGRFADAARELVFLGRQSLGRNRSQAADYLNEAVELDPENREARSLLAGLEGSSAGPAPHAVSRYDEGPGGDIEPIDLDAEDIVEEIPLEASSPRAHPERVDSGRLAEMRGVGRGRGRESPRDRGRERRRDVEAEPERPRFGGGFEDGQYATETGQPWVGEDEDVLPPDEAGLGPGGDDFGGDYGSGQEAYVTTAPREERQQSSGVIELHGETTDTLGGGTPSSEIIPLGVEPTPSEAQLRAHQEEESTGIEDDLEEAEFFIQQNLFGEARTILEDLAQRFPQNQLVQGKLVDLAAMEGQEPPPVATTSRTESSTDLAAALAEEFDELERTDLPPPGEATDAGYSVENVFDDFKRGVGNQVADEDSDTHYDLGIAYREMGLMDDAIAEFKVAMRSREKEALCHMMIGLCYIEKEMLSEAISQFKTGLYVEGITDRETIALYFELGQAYEKLEDAREALYYYEKVAKKDPRFRDVATRIQRIRKLAGNGDGRREGGGGGGGDSGTASATKSDEERPHKLV